MSNLKPNFNAKSWQKSQKDFAQDFVDQTKPVQNPQTDLDRIWDNKARLYLRPTKIDSGHAAFMLNEIKSLQPASRSGFGNKAMNFLVELSNKHNIVLRLELNPYGDKSSPLYDKNNLQNWYEKFGFQKVREKGSLMERIPLPPNPSQDLTFEPNI